MYNVSTVSLKQTFLPFQVQYAGIVSESSSAIHDDTSRTDLLRLIDNGKREGRINASAYSCDNAILELNAYAIRLKEIQDASLILTCPVQMVANVGHIIENCTNIVALKFVDAPDCESSHLCIMYVNNTETAENICTILEKCFNAVHLDFAVSAAQHDVKNFSIGGLHSSSDLQSIERSSCVTASYARESSTTTPSSSDKSYTELVNEYLALLTSQLSADEIHQFWSVFKPGIVGQMPIAEMCQKLLELFANERKHLLARMRPFIKSGERADFDTFLEQNGISDNAASSLPSWSPASIETGQSTSMDMSILNVMTPPIKQIYRNEYGEETKM